VAATFILPIRKLGRKKNSWKRIFG
jgi:hypothetical protein